MAMPKSVAPGLCSLLIFFLSVLLYCFAYCWLIIVFMFVLIFLLLYDTIPKTSTSQNVKAKAKQK
jgi:hypothetical protein